MIRRRAFIALLGGAAAAWPCAARAQQPATLPLVGVIYGVSAAEWAEYMAAFRRSLAEMGFVEGRDVAIEYHWPPTSSAGRLSWPICWRAGRPSSSPAPATPVCAR